MTTGEQRVSLAGLTGQQDVAPLGPSYEFANELTGLFWPIYIGDFWLWKQDCGCDRCPQQPCGDRTAK